MVWPWSRLMLKVSWLHFYFILRSIVIRLSLLEVWGRLEGRLSKLVCRLSFLTKSRSLESLELAEKVPGSS